MTRFARGQRGFTMIEMMAALSVFALMTVGIAPLLGSSIRGADLSRSYTVGKNVVQDGMERVRGLPFYTQNTIAPALNPPRVDLLDLYFPNLTAAPAGGTGYIGTSNGEAVQSFEPPRPYYRVVCTSTTASQPACPNDPAGGSRLPVGTTLTFMTRFVRATPPPSGTVRETYTTVTPATGYTWASISNLDAPPTNIAEVTIRATWPHGGRTRSFSLRSLVGDRRIGEIRVQAAGRVVHAAQVGTSYVTGLNQTSELASIAGQARSEISLRSLARAFQEVKVGEATLTRLASSTSDATVLGSIVGAFLSGVTAPPAQTPANLSGESGTLLHPELSNKPIAFLPATETQGVSVNVTNDLPSAAGSFRFFPEGDTGSTYNFWVNNQTEDPDLNLQANEPIFSISPAGSGSGAGSNLTGSSTATSTAVAPASSRAVSAAALTSFKRACLFRTNYIPTNLGGPCAIKIEDFSASVKCVSVPSASAGVTATYQFRLSYYRDNNKNGQQDGSYVFVPGNVPGDATLVRVTYPQTVTNAFAGIKTSNPRVYDGPDALGFPSSDKDVFLFPKTVAGAPQNKGLLTDWTHLTAISGQVAEGGRSTNGRINGAISITTAATSATHSQTGLNISIGSLDCTALDRR